MPGKTTRIAACITLLLYSVGANEAHTLNVFPTGESFGAAQTQVPQAAAAAPALSTQSATTVAPAMANTPHALALAPAEGPRRGRAANAAGKKSNGSNRTRAGRAPAARKLKAAGLAGVETRRQDLTTGYYNHAGRQLVITSGYRTPSGQARAMYNNLRRYGVAYVLRVYRQKAAVREIVAAYKPRRARPRRAIAAMTRVIEAQTQRGLFVSRHLLGRAFDVRSRGRHGARLSLLREVTQEMGGRVLVEKSHYHVEL